MTTGFILMKSGSQWNLVRVENNEGEAKAAFLVRPLADRVVELLNRFGEEDLPLPIDETAFAPPATPIAAAYDASSSCVHWTCTFCHVSFPTLQLHNEHRYGCITLHQDEDAS